MITKEDNELVYEVLHGSISSFEVLIDRYQKTIFNMMLRMTGDFETARDLTQDIFVKAFEKLGSFDFRYRFFSWIYRIAVNEAINSTRKKAPTRNLDGVDLVDLEESGAKATEARSKLLHNVLSNLETDYRILVLLKYYCGMSYDEISEVTKVPVKKVRSRLYIAREQLRKELIEKGFFEND